MCKSDLVLQLPSVFTSHFLCIALSQPCFSPYDLPFKSFIYITFHIGLWSTYLLFVSPINFIPPRPTLSPRSLFMYRYLGLSIRMSRRRLSLSSPPGPPANHFCTFLMARANQGATGAGTNAEGGLPVLHSDSWLPLRMATGGIFHMPSLQEMLGTIRIKISEYKNFVLNCLCSQAK